MQAVGHRELIVMGSYAILDERINVDITDINLALIVIDEIYLFFVVNCLGLVNFDYLLLLQETTGVLRAVLTPMEEFFAATLAELESLRVLIDFFQEVFLVIDNPLLAFQIVNKLVVIISVAQSEVVVQLHSLFLGLCLLKVLLAVLTEGCEVPLLDRHASSFCQEFTVLIAFSADFKKLLVCESEQMWLTVKAPFVRAILVVELERVIGLGVILRFTLFEGEFKDVFVFRVTNPLLWLLLRSFNYNSFLYLLRRLARIQPIRQGLAPRNH